MEENNLETNVSENEGGEVSQSEVTETSQVTESTTNEGEIHGEDNEVQSVEVS